MGKFAPLIIGFAVWLIAEAILKRRSYVLLILCIAASYMGFFLGVGLVIGPSVPTVRVITVALLGAAIAPAVAAYIYFLVTKSASRP
jgi:hypothetical protein